MYLVIAEKPSVAKSIANVIGAYREEDGYLSGNDCIVSWCLGHLAEYEQPDYYDEKYKNWNFDDLPIIPDPWRLEVTPGKKQQYNVLKNLLTNNIYGVEFVVNACDAGREGELIFRRVYDLARCQLPVKRLWISSMEDKAILDGLRNLEDGRMYDALAAASACRAKSDWLLGINDTRALTTTYGRKLIVGRVKTPTLAMITEREDAIADFQKEQYFMVHIMKDELNAVSERIVSREQAERIAASCSGLDAVCSYVKRDQKTAAPPKLYDLTSLQRDANRLFGMTAKESLESAQNLYESKLITYPRTDSRFLTEDMEETAVSVIGRIREKIPFISFGSMPTDLKMVMDNSKVSDHHAMIPTEELGSADIGSLSKRDRNILFLIATRLMCATGMPHRYTVTSALFSCGGYEFKAQGKNVDELGWKAYEESMKNYCKADQNEDDESGCEENGTETSYLPEIVQGQIIPCVDTAVTDHWTSPPKHFTEASLLAAMERAGAREMDDDVERKGLGTPATRAATIEDLISQGYLVRKKKQLLPTDEGKLLISLVPSYLKSASLTADWENRLLDMERRRADPDEFLDDVISQIIYLLAECREIPEERRSLYRKNQAINSEEVGKCPKCGSAVLEDRKTFYCSEKCGFRMWKENRYLGNMKKNLTRKMAEDLLEDRKTFVKGLYSKKKDKRFDAYLLMDVKDGSPFYSLEFPARSDSKEYGNRKGRKKDIGNDISEGDGDE